MIKKKVGIVGAGVYGQALNKLLSLNENNEVLISDVISKDLPNFVSMDEVLKCEYLVFAIPSKFVYDFLVKHKDKFSKEQKILIGTKGFASDGTLLSSNFANYFLRENICYLAGPGFASEIMENPEITRLNISGFKIKVAEEFSTLFCDKVCSYTNDILSFEITSALKNVAAFICGISYGKFESLNLKYAVASKMYCEIGAVVEFFGGNVLTCLTNPLLQADLYMTASQKKSRNFKFGAIVANGESFKKCVSELDFTVESLETINALEKMKVLNSNIFKDLVIFPKICDLASGKINLDEFILVLRNLNFSCCEL